MLNRRKLLLLPAMAAAAKAQKSGDPDWMAKFKAFTKELNLFVLELNEDRFDAKRWKRVQAAWEKLEPR